MTQTVVDAQSSHPDLPPVAEPCAAFLPACDAEDFISSGDTDAAPRADRGLKEYDAMLVAELEAEAAGRDATKFAGGSGPDADHDSPLASTPLSGRNRATDQACCSPPPPASRSVSRSVRTSRGRSGTRDHSRSPSRARRSSRDSRARERSHRHPGRRDRHTRERAPSPRARPLPHIPVDHTQGYWMVQQANSLFLTGASPADTLATLLQCAHETSAATQEYQRTPSRARYDAAINRVHTTRAAALAVWDTWTTAVRLLSTVHPRTDLIYYLPDIRVHIEFYSGQRFFTIQRREDYLPARDVLCIFDGPALVGAYNLATRELAVTHKYVETALDQHFSYTASQQLAPAAAPGFAPAHSRHRRH